MKNPLPPKETLHIRVYGRVQGVCFRASTQEIAQDLQLQGWVRNDPLGHVEIVAHGEKTRLETFVKWCHEGPPLANVSRVWVQAVNQEKNDEDIPHRFEIRY